MSQITVIFKDFDEMKRFARELLRDELQQSKGNDEKPASNQQPPTEPEVALEEPSVYTLVDVRAKLSELNKAGKKAQVQELIKSFGAEKLSQISEEQYPELMQKAGEL